MFDVQRLQKSWQQEVEGINALVCDLSEAEARASIRDDGWTTLDVIQHVGGTARALLALLRSGGPSNMTLTSIAARDHWNDEQRAKNAELAWSEVRQRWSKTSRDVAQTLAGLTPEQAEQVVTIPWLPQVTNAGEMLRVVLIHTRSHHSELSTGLQALAMRNC